MLSVSKLFEIEGEPEIYDIEKVKQIPADIFNLANEKNSSFSNHQEYLTWSNEQVVNILKTSKLTKDDFKNKLIIYAYGNGDYAVYDIKNEDVLDYNHETDAFEA